MSTSVVWLALKGIVIVFTDDLALWPTWSAQKLRCVVHVKKTLLYISVCNWRMLEYRHRILSHNHKLSQTQIACYISETKSELEAELRKWHRWSLLYFMMSWDVSVPRVPSASIVGWYTTIHCPSLSYRRHLLWCSSTKSPRFSVDEL